MIIVTKIITYRKKNIKRVLIHPVSIRISLLKIELYNIAKIYTLDQKLRIKFITFLFKLFIQNNCHNRFNLV